MSKPNYAKSTISGMIYRFAERIGAQLTSMVVTIVLARILTPEDYGTVSLITIFITICNVFVSDGLSSSLIQKKDSDELDFSTIFWVSFVLAISLYILLFLSAPLLALYYNNEMVCPILRVMGIRIIFASYNSVQSAFVSKNLMFKKFFYATLTGTVISGVLGIAFAYSGFGPWALVIQYLTNVIVDTVFLSFTIQWKPKLIFDFNRFKSLFSFGWKVLLSGLIGEIYEELRSLIIAKKYSTSDLSFYSKGRQFPQIIGNNVSSTITNVMFPVFSLEQSDTDTLKRMVRRSMKAACYVLCPLMIGLASIGENLVVLILTPKWIDCVPFLQIFSFLFIFKPIKNINKSAIKAKRRSDLDLFVNIIEKVIGVALIFLSFKLGTIYLAFSALVTYIIASICNGVVCSRLIGYSLREQLMDSVPFFLLAFISCLPSFLLNGVNMNIYLLILIQIGSAVIMYVGVSYVLKVETFFYLFDALKKYFGKHGD